MEKSILKLSGQKRFTLSRGFTFHYLSKKVEDIITSNNTGFSLDKRIGMKKGKGGRWSFESRKRYPVRGRRMSEGRYNLRRYPEADPANVDYSVDIQDVLDAFESIVSSTGWYRGKSQDGRWEFDTQMSFDMISVYKILFNANGVSYTYPFDEYNPTEVLGIYEGSPDNLLPVSEVCRPLTKLWEKLRYSGNIPDVLPKRTIFSGGRVEDSLGRHSLYSED